MAGAKVSPEIKAAALADLLAGEQPAIVAQRYGLDPAKVRVWKQRHVTESVTDRVTPVTPAPVVRPTVEAQQRQIGEIVLDLLRAKLEASAAIAKAASDPQWLKLQPAAELAVLGQWLDASAFAIGDRLAGAGPRSDGSEATDAD